MLKAQFSPLPPVRLAWDSQLLKGSMLVQGQKDGEEILLEPKEIVYALIYPGVYIPNYKSNQKGFVWMGYNGGLIFKNMENKICDIMTQFRASTLKYNPSLIEATATALKA